MENRIVIVGAGYAGVLTAKKLAKKFKKDDTVSITIIDKNPYHTMLTELHEVAAGRVSEDSIRISLKKIFAGRKVEVKLDFIKSIDFEQKKVVGENSSYDYTYLVIAAGSKPTFFGIDGAEENSYKLWSYDDAIVLKERILSSFRKASGTANVDERRRLLSFYVVGAGFTGVEMIGELAEYVPFLCKQFEIDREEVSLYNVDLLTRSVPILPKKLSAKVEKRLAKMGVKQLLGTKVVEIGKDYIVTEKDNVENKAAAGTVIWAAGIESADITSEAAKNLPSEHRGRIKTDAYLRSVSDQNVFVVGDNTYYIAEGAKASVPQMVENCEQGSAVCANNIYSLITGKKELKEYKPKFHGIMVSIGGRYGVAHVGLPGKLFGLPSFLAMLAKHFINVIYFVQILGWNKIFSYIKHEFLTIRNRRSFLGGHFSNRSPSFLVVPLRLWLGAVWVFEGVMKIAQGWFEKPYLQNFIGETQKWYDGIISSASTVAGATAADAAAGATGSASSALETIINWDIFGWFRVLLITSSDWVGMKLDTLALKINIPFMNEIFENSIYTNDNLMITMQIVMVLLEVLIGLALLGGLFTTPACVGTLVLSVMFMTTTGLYFTSIWMIFAAIAIIFTGSRTLSLDYYFMPWLKKQWNKIPFVRKLYIYHD